MRSHFLLILIGILTFNLTHAQKMVLDHDAYDQWRRIKNEQLSRDGQTIAYTVVSNGEADPILKVAKSDGTELLTYNRGEKPEITFDSRFVIFTIKPSIDSLKEKRRNKVKKEDLPKDSIAIYAVETGELKKIPGKIDHKVPEKWSGWFAYRNEIDSVKDKSDSKTLTIYDLNADEAYQFPKVSAYKLSEEGGKLAFESEGDSTFTQGVYVFDTKSASDKPVFRAKGKYFSMTWDKQGNQLAFITDLDTTKSLLRQYDLHLWDGADSSRRVANSELDIFENDWQVSEKFSNYFSEDGSRLFFGAKEYPIIQDTTLLEEDIVNVEVWTYTDQRLFTQQEIEKEKDLNKAYTTVYDIKRNQVQLLGNLNIPEVIVGKEGNSNNAIGMDPNPYKKYISWEGFPYYHDLYAIDVAQGNARIIKEKVMVIEMNMSPNGNYAYWYDMKDSSWFTYSYEQDLITKVTNNNEVPFYDERHDTPSDPWPYGLMAWTENDQRMLIYDRWDIWEVDPSGKRPIKNLTKNGRRDQLKYRYVKLDEEEKFIKQGQQLMLTGFYEKDKSQAVFSLNYGAGKGPKMLMSGDYKISNFKKAQEDDEILFTKENFNVFPDLRIARKNFKQEIRISNANPQQAKYNWGSIELVRWTSLDGTPLEGMLVKPEGFDPNKKYPMIVNFYEKSADRLNNHRDPFPHRSTINYSFYASRGYLIFNPDVHYKTGYPGESAFNCVISGVNALIEKGFVDEERIGTQGHSWGGYQVAYLVTKTDIFACAESGAPVPNMISAYGGIRWWTGLSRMFQYEHTQSRIGGTLWDYPERYIENSPIFYIDKVNTPLLIMHNDKDGHVPWYQGIEFFVALRRLGKPSWFLNYQGEPHWPQKLENRIDFNIRMQQFFDFYLKDKPKPRWMQEGVPATKMGIDQGLDLIEENEIDN